MQHAAGPSQRLATTNPPPPADAALAEGGELDGRPYYMMDYVRGRDLTEWLAERRRTPQESANLVAQVCQAMEYAHSRGVVHHDLKPENVLVAFENDRPMVCDFGLARYKADTQNVTQTGQIMGTPSYMSPEQALGRRHKIGPPTDVYALGAICYYLWTGRPPFSGTSPFQTIERVVRTAPRPPSQLNPDVPPALEAVVLKALAKEPTDRYPTCGELGKLLANVQHA